MNGNNADDETAIRSVIDRWVAAFKNKSPDDALALHGPEIVSFDIVPPLRYVGLDAYRKPWEAAFAAFDGPITLDLEDLNVVVRSGAGYSHCLVRFRGVRKDGVQADYWMRWTACFLKSEQRWLIVHDHSSLPTDFVTGMSRQDLLP